MITKFLFDLGVVLFTNGRKRFIKKLSTKYNLSEEVVKNDIDGRLRSEYQESKITRDEFWKVVILTLNLKEDADTLEKQWINGYEIIEETVFKQIILDPAKNMGIDTILFSLPAELQIILIEKGLLS